MSSTLLGLPRLQEFFECFSWYEFDRLAALDLDLFAGLWIDARARLPCGNFNRSHSIRRSVKASQNARHLKGSERR